MTSQTCHKFHEKKNSFEEGEGQEKRSERSCGGIQYLPGGSILFHDKLSTSALMAV